jgi:putative transposase
MLPRLGVIRTCESTRNRLGRGLSRKVAGSANRREAAARLARAHARIANVRADALHKTTNMLTARYETVVIEDLNVSGMLANRRLARAGADRGLAQVGRLLTYKTLWKGGRLLVADRWFPSSKTCSACKVRKSSLTLAERTFTCETCGLVLDRDVNAAVNLCDLAASGAERRNACGPRVSPGLAGRSGLKQEPGLAGTVAGQPAAT